MYAENRVSIDAWRKSTLIYLYAQRDAARKMLNSAIQAGVDTRLLDLQLKLIGEACCYLNRTPPDAAQASICMRQATELLGGT